MRARRTSTSATGSTATAPANAMDYATSDPDLIAAQLIAELI
jgi:hypothetical protein